LKIGVSILFKIKAIWKHFQLLGHVVSAFVNEHDTVAIKFYLQTGGRPKFGSKIVDCIPLTYNNNG
jgi:hypothetical protein